MTRHYGCNLLLIVFYKDLLQSLCQRHRFSADDKTLDNRVNAIMSTN